nr:RHS repeat-associated core domain-containing protein [Pseudoalteromonas sp. T1lg122]
MNGRVYDYNLGRFMSVDPFVHEGSQGINPYSYIMNNPLAGTDPTGYAPEKETIEVTKDTQVFKDKDGNNYVDAGDGSGDLIKVDSISTSSGGNTVTANFGGNGTITSMSASNSAGTLSITDIGGEQQKATFQSSRDPDVPASDLFTPQKSERVDGNRDKPGFWDKAWASAKSDFSSWGAFKHRLYGSLMATPGGSAATISMRMPSIASKFMGAIGFKSPFTVATSKFDFFFGRVTTGNAHNIARSAQNLKDLNTLGIKSERQLMAVFQNALTQGRYVSTQTNQHGTSVLRSLNIGGRGEINVSYFYRGGNMNATPSVTTIIPKIYK